MSGYAQIAAASSRFLLPSQSENACVYCSPLYAAVAVWLRQQDRRPSRFLHHATALVYSDGYEYGYDTQRTDSVTAVTASVQTDDIGRLRVRTTSTHRDDYGYGLHV
eukprot:scaffold76040_cov17-Prasinocladus_malaysianus.AAC.2